MQALILVVCISRVCSLPGLPALSLDKNSVTISGISSGADLASHAATALSDLIFGAAIFAGEPWGCAIQRFPGEPSYDCSVKAGGSVGPGCPGGGFPGMAQCVGCDPGKTLSYDHCKHDASHNPPVLLNPAILVEAAITASQKGLIAPTYNLRRTRVLGFRGSLDSCYLDGSVNATVDFFRAFAEQDKQVVMVAGWPMQHALPTIDPILNSSSCGKDVPTFNAMANCGYDGAGESLKHMFGSSASLTPPASHACEADCTENLHPFNQTLYIPGDWQGGELSSQGWLYIPKACSGVAAAGCKLHISLHGCGMSMWGDMGMNYVKHSGFNPWGEANNIVILYPQSGGFLERGEKGPSDQLTGGCFDGYGQTRDDFAYSTGPQLATLRNMIKALQLS